MKRIIIVLLTAALMSNVASAQKISADKVPAAVLSTFKAKFPNATKTSWELEIVNEYEAGFKLNSEEVSANFDNTGKWLETETEIKVSALPAAVQAALTKDFAGFKIEEASKIESAKDGKCYEAEIEKGEETFDVLFTPDGKMLSKTKLEKEKDEKD
ncbi:MAG: PepSY-like domain-containing protein [Saprospiraceae bacterium]|uniref:PepSY-like domain-containing protein n=1 Tax=Candidatus Defluviibacterium haderslevense TaxID=2981993 RepID=A0A9D7XE40_9BACT|nr:PepSY-like domain-containing protein [Candidatus Defluviibacterium haderslevense]